MKYAKVKSEINWKINFLKNLDISQFLLNTRKELPLVTLCHFLTLDSQYWDCMVDVLMGFHQSTFSKPNAEFYSYLEVINDLQHVFEKWVEHCKKCIACQGRYFKKEIITAPPQCSNLE
jgi:hypothetical protein